MIVAPPAAQAQSDTTLFAEAETLKAKGDLKAAYSKAKSALALAEGKSRVTDSQRYAAIERFIPLIPSDDLEGQFQAYDRIAPLAAGVKGENSFEAHETRAGRNLLAFFLGKPGASIEAIAQPLALAAPLADNDKDRADTAAMAMLLAQFYDARGERSKAAEVVGLGAKLYETMPAKPDPAWTGGVTALAKTYAGWGEWQKSLDTADLAIRGVIAGTGGKTIDAGPALIHRGNALLRFQRYGEAEVAYREALALADIEQRTNDYLLVSALTTLANFYATTGRQVLARPMLTRAADLAKPFPPGAGSRFAALSDLYAIAMRDGAFAEALGYARLARDDLETRSFKGSVQHATVLIQLANAGMLVGDRAAARAALDQADAILAKATKPGDPRYGEAAIARGRLELGEGQLELAVSSLRKGLTLMETQRAPDRTSLAFARAVLARALLLRADPAAAWVSGRGGADTMTSVIVARSSQPAAIAVVAAQEAAVFDRAIETAWAARSLK